MSAIRRARTFAAPYSFKLRVRWFSWWSNLLVYSGYLLVQDYAQNKVYVIDISNPDAPTKFSEWSVPWMVDGGDAGMTINGHIFTCPADKPRCSIFTI